MCVCIYTHITHTYIQMNLFIKLSVYEIYCRYLSLIELYNLLNDLPNLGFFHLHCSVIYNRMMVLFDS